MGTAKKNNAQVYQHNGLTSILTLYRLYLVSHGQTAFFRFSLVWRKKRKTEKSGLATRD